MAQTLSSLAAAVFAGEQSSTQRGSGIAGDRLDVHALEAAARFQSTNEKHVQEEASRKTDGIQFGPLAKFRSDFKDNFFDDVRSAARQGGAEYRVGSDRAGIEAEFLSKLGRERAAAAGGSAEMAQLERGEAVGATTEELAKGLHKFGLAIFAEPLHFVFVEPRAETKKLGDPRMKPTQGIRKPQSPQRADLLIFSRRNQSRPHVAVFIEGEDQSAIEFRQVVGASRMAEMMLEMEDRSRVARQAANLGKLCKFTKRSADRTRPIRRAGSRKPQAKLEFCFAQGLPEQPTGKRDDLHVREVHAVLLEAPLDRQAWYPTGAGRAVQFFLFNCRENGGVVQQDRGRIGAETPNAECEHELNFAQLRRACT